MLQRGQYSALVLELKAPDGRGRKSQKDWLERMNEAGYLGVMAWGWVKASDVIEAYLCGGLCDLTSNALTWEGRFYVAK